MVHTSGYHLLSIIEDIIEVSKLDTKQVLVSSNEFDINDFSRVVYESMLVEVPKEKNIEFVMEESDISEGTTISTDEVKLKQVVLNLITNAFKYSLEGKVIYKYNINPNKYFFFVFFIIIFFSCLWRFKKLLVCFAFSSFSP